MNTTIQMNEERPGSIRPYVCWLFVLGLGFYDLVFLREVVISVLIVMGVDPKVLLLLDKVGFFFFGVLGLLIILLTEPYLRKGWQQRCLIRRLLILAVLGFGSLSVTWAMLMALPGLVDAARPSLLDLVTATALLTVSAVLFSRLAPEAGGQSDS